MSRTLGVFRRTGSLAVIVLAVLSLLLTVLSPPASTQDRPLLRQGSTGDAVLTLEQRLTELGFDPGPVNTTFDQSTRSAVIAFQRTANIATDGIVGPITWTHLDQGTTAPAPQPSPDPQPSRPLLRQGSTGDAVLTLEQRLTELGFDPGPVNTTFDQSTRSAVIAFQRTANIATDGIVGPITWTHLDQGTTAPAPQPSPDPQPSRPLLRQGSTGDAVLTLEQRLTELGFDPGPVNTTFDQSTRSAVIAFQRTANIATDGIVGPITWTHLDRGTTAPAPAPAPSPAPNAILKVGDSGPQVKAVQERLLGLGYWLADVDGVYDSNTAHAVTALQKAAGLSRDGVVGPRTRAVLDRGYRPSARSGNGTVVEVDLARQILMVVVDGRVETIYDTATGKIVGTTPSGTYKVTRQIDGFRYAPLGTLYRPKYFYGGVAIHGYTSVPPYPASHGCVRLTYPAMDHIWSSGVAPVGATVMVYR